MQYFDIFNGDADGICALLQLRLANPCDSTLITGVKRDISLVKNASVSAGDQLTVLDISLDKNRDGLVSALEKGAEVFYVDHHFAGDIPENPKLTTIINTSADVCTSLLVNKHLNNAHILWSIVGTFGDNLDKSAQSLAKNAGVAGAQLDLLQNLGIYINYNGYGSAEEDLHFHPADLYRLLSEYKDPFEFVEQGKETFQKLEHGYHEDMGLAGALKPEYTDANVKAFVMPSQPWCRRVSGVYSNDLAKASPDHAHAVVTEKADGNYVVSIRAPLNNKTGADEFCRGFATGGGRKAAAGINDLPAEMLPEFIDRFAAFYKNI